MLSGEDPRAISAKDVEAVSFSTALHGYDLEQTDELFDRITETLRRYESGLELRPQHMTAQQVVEADLPISTPGYETNEINSFVDWVVWTLKRYESGLRPDRASVADRHHPSADVVQDDPAETTPSANPPANLDGEERSIVEPPEQADQPSQQRRPMTFDELLEQAKKWMNR